MVKPMRAGFFIPVFFRLLKFCFFLFFAAILIGATGHFLHAQTANGSPSGFSSGMAVPPPPPDISHDFGDNSPDVYVCFGDSITKGVFLSNSAEAYPARLQALLGKTVINEGINGSRSYQGANRVAQVLNRHKPGYLLTLYGVNDIGERSNEAILKSLRHIIQSARNNKTIPVIATLTPVFGGRAWKEPSVRDLNERIRAMAGEENIPLADLEKAFDWDHSMFPDGLHPNARGHELIAQTFYEVLKSKPSSGGGGCTFNPQGTFGLEWFLLFSAMLLKIVWGLFVLRLPDRTSEG